MYKEYQRGNERVDLIFVCDPERVEGEDQEFIAGKLAYEQGI